MQVVVNQQSSGTVAKDDDERNGTCKLADSWERCYREVVP